MGWILLLILILVLVATIPAYPYSHGWGYGPSGLAGLLLAILLILLIMGLIPWGLNFHAEPGGVPVNNNPVNIAPDR